ncbi:transcription antitermination factor NusB [Stratiformator vulcanicus]|uniref:Transcription antitermination protein NusB n=1 Tax=Stratiformator vulcanicus TaxID=2527980 RepID=A0A517R6B7_9PLAN|nr:transcription antitermination factor NusB [Stratiformator vulcanicus]QDT39385.1 hypothetical protein Pan189_37920 [Stratiformator vulcanicus]
MSRRTKAREVAVQMLYQLDLNSDVAMHDVRGMIEEQLDDADLSAFSWRLFVGTMEFRGIIDEKLAAAANNWSIDRMAPTDRNVLRLGVFELLNTDTPPRVVIDEAVEVAKRFGSENSSQFVNGLLDRLIPPEKRAELDG